MKFDQQTLEIRRRRASPERHQHGGREKCTLSYKGSLRWRVRKQDLKVQEVAKSQHGAISWPQLQGLGFNRLQVKRRVRAGEWVRELPGVWRLSWAEPTWMHRVWCAS